VNVQVKHIFAGTHANFVTAHQVSGIFYIPFKNYIFPLDFREEFETFYLFLFLLQQ
jgi:hypothetical protein